VSGLGAGQTTSAFSWDAERFNRRVHDTPLVLRATPGDPAVISLAFGAPDPALFPTADLLAATEAALRDGPTYAVGLQYGATNGNPLLLAELARKLAAEEGRPVDPAGLVITSGSSQAIALAVQALANPGDVCLLEVPTFMGTIRTIQFNEITAVPVPQDAEGLDLLALERAWTRLSAAGTPPRFLYTIPTFNNPTGVTMPLARRQALLDLAARHGLPIVEDDAYRDLAFEGEPPPTLHTLDRAGLVIRLGTFSKIVAPGVRLGFLLAHPEVVARVQGFKSEGLTNGFSSMVVGTLMREGRLARHIADLRRAYRARRDAMCAALEAEMPDGVAWRKPAGGFFVWLSLAPVFEPRRILAAASEEGVSAMPGTACHPDGQGTHHLRLAFSRENEARITEGIRRLGRAVRSGRP
jgi:DNA-binding transcriptional MocR family regulator